MRDASQIPNRFQRKTATDLEMGTWGFRKGVAAFGVVGRWSFSRVADSLRFLCLANDDLKC